MYGTLLLSPAYILVQVAGRTRVVAGTFNSYRYIGTTFAAGVAQYLSPRHAFQLRCLNVAAEGSATSTTC
jgi:hypothetical protein